MAKIQIVKLLKNHFR